MYKYCIAILFIGLVSCKNDKPQESNSKLLSPSLVANPNTAEGVDANKLNAMPVISFKDTLHDFGNLNAGEIGSYEFEFTNTGRSPLIISEAKASCGCTVADYPKTPIAPSATEKMKVTFNSAGKSGHQEKAITITTNAKRAVNYLYIKAEVKGSKENTGLPTE